MSPELLPCPTCRRKAHLTCIELQRADDASVRWIPRAFHSARIEKADARG